MCCTPCQRRHTHCAGWTASFNYVLESRALGPSSRTYLGPSEDEAMWVIKWHEILNLREESDISLLQNPNTGWELVATDEENKSLSRKFYTLMDTQAPRHYDLTKGARIHSSKVPNQKTARAFTWKAYTFALNTYIATFSRKQRYRPVLPYCCKRLE